MSAGLEKIDIPDGKEIVKISIVDSKATLDLDSQSCHTPVFEGLERLVVPSYAFLIERETGEKVLFDLGIRKDWENLPPALVNNLSKQSWKFTTHMNVSEVLEQHGVHIQEGDVKAVIWSHAHFDHIGDLTTFPKSTNLVVGKEFRQQFLPGYPTDPNAKLFDHDFQNRTIEQIDFDGSFRIGPFLAHDYFGNGSLYLLDTPGHMQSHVCALARTSISPPSFVLLAGDACHHSGEMRPSPHVTLPQQLDPSPIPSIHHAACPGSIFQTIHPHRSTVEPFFSPTQSLNDNLEEANKTITGLQQLDGDERVWVIIAHDSFLGRGIPAFPFGTLNEWRQKGWKGETRWAFLENFKGATEFKKVVQSLGH